MTPRLPRRAWAMKRDLWFQGSKPAIDPSPGWMLPADVDPPVSDFQWYGSLDSGYDPQAAERWAERARRGLVELKSHTHSPPDTGPELLLVPHAVERVEEIPERIRYWAWNYVTYGRKDG
jgi:hypothetical protein